MNKSKHYRVETEWRCPKWAYQKFENLIAQLEQHTEESDAAHAIRDEIRSLPNYPSWATEHDLIHIEVT